MMHNKVQKVYIDTSVIGGCFDQDFAVWSNGLFQDFKEGNFIPVVSGIVEIEISKAPVNVQKKYDELIGMNAQFLKNSSEAINLAEIYKERKILTPKYFDDGMHIALATIAEVDILVSWNFKHIVHYDKIRMFNAIHMELGYKTLTIYSPMEVTNYGRQN